MVISPCVWVPVWKNSTSWSLWEFKEFESWKLWSPTSRHTGSVAKPWMGRYGKLCLLEQVEGFPAFLTALSWQSCPNVGLPTICQQSVGAWPLLGVGIYFSSGRFAGRLVKIGSNWKLFNSETFSPTELSHRRMKSNGIDYWHDNLGAVQWRGLNGAVKYMAAWQKGKVQEGLMAKGMDFLAMHPSFRQNLPAADVGS